MSRVIREHVKADIMKYVFHWTGSTRGGTDIAHIPMLELSTITPSMAYAYRMDMNITPLLKVFNTIIVQMFIYL